MNFRVLYLVPALVLGGCGLLNNITQTPQQVLISAHQTHDALARELDLAATSGLLHGSAAATASHYLSESETYLVQADGYLAAGNSITALISLANSDMAKAKPLIPGAN